MHIDQVDVGPIESLVQELWDQGGTDIHLTAGAPPMFRIDGELYAATDRVPLMPDDVERIASAMLPDALQESFLIHRQIDFSFSWRDVSRFRGNIFRQRGTVSIALRSIPYQIPTMEELLLPPVMHQFCAQRQGLVLITGPTGSGKSTTQAAMIGEINQTQRRHILTLEDPIEYVHAHARSIVSQREVGFDTMTFQDGLRAAEAGDEIWVAQGVYVPTKTGDRGISFVLKSGLSLYGGFEGWENHKSQRKGGGQEFANILSGFINESTH